MGKLRRRVLLRLKRPLGLDQLTGFAMMTAAMLLYLQPASVAFEWLELVYGLPQFSLVTIGIPLMFFCGFGLALALHTTSRGYAALSLPIAGLGFLIFLYALTERIFSGVGMAIGFLLMGFWAILQYAHGLAEVIRAWTT